MSATVEALGVEAARVPAVVEVKGPMSVTVGAGGNPVILAIACFGIAGTCVGMVLIGVVPLTALSMIVPIILGITALFQVIATVWAILLGMTFVAVFAGLFSGFWWSLSLLLLGLGHNWYGIPAAAVPHVEAVFFIAWTVTFFMLLIPCLRLPAVFPAIVVAVLGTLIFITLAVWNANVDLFTVAGWILLIGAGLGWIVFLNNASQSLGGPASPPLGPPIVK